jgi:hypothetical protein
VTTSNPPGDGASNKDSWPPALKPQKMGHTATTAHFKSDNGKGLLRSSARSNNTKMEQIAHFVPAAGPRGRLKVRTKLGLALVPFNLHQDRPLLGNAQRIAVSKQTAKCRNELCV